MTRVADQSSHGENGRTDQPAGREPDYRMSLAAERTYLAYQRTALALLAGGVAVAGALPDAGHLGLRRVMGVVLVVLGAFIAVTARRRLQAVMRAMRQGEPLPPSLTPVVTAVGIGIAAGLALVLVLIV
jgi:inner membrane protein YidH